MTYTKAQIELAKKRQGLKTDSAAIYILDYNSRQAAKIWKRRRNTERIKRQRAQIEGYKAYCMAIYS